MKLPENKIKFALDFDFTDINSRCAKDNAIPLTVVKEMELELKRFLVLSAINSDTTYEMRGPVDKLWHTFIMFSREYVDFCFGLANRYIHHVPHTSSKEDESTDKGANYSKFLKDYKSFFHIDAPIHLWPRILRGHAEADAGSCGCGCRDDDGRSSNSSAGW